jgi:hypothetical protein
MPKAKGSSRQFPEGDEENPMGDWGFPLNFQIPSGVIKRGWEIHYKLSFFLGNSSTNAGAAIGTFK